jgi:hypothetical protein
MKLYINFLLKIPIKNFKNINFFQKFLLKHFFYETLKSLKFLIACLEISIGRYRDRDNNVLANLSNKIISGSIGKLFLSRNSFPRR